MQITWNGTGAAWSTQFGNSSAVVEAEGRRLLVDCGHTAPARLAPLGLSLRDLDGVFISHLHGDHIYGLEEWGFKNFLIWNVKPTLLLSEDLIEPLWNKVLAGTMAQVCNATCVLDDYFEVVPLRVGTPQTFGPWTLEIHPVLHVPHAPSYGLKLRTNEVAVGFTCDARAPLPAWFYEGTEVVFHDCSLYPFFPDTVHAHYEEIAAYPEALRHKTFLVHYGDDLIEKQQDAAWLATFKDSGLRLAEPYKTVTF